MNQWLLRKSRLVCLAIALVATASGAATVAGEIDAAAILIEVDDIVIDAAEFERIFAEAVRYKYYHGKVPEAELARFRRQVARDLIDQLLVHREAVRQGLVPDRSRIEQGIASYDRRYAASPEWQAQRERIVPHLAERLERQDLIEQMRAGVEHLPTPDRAQVYAYYRQNPEQFTEPSRTRVALILLAVAPGASQAEWDDALARAGELRRRLDAGESFAALARQFSAHASAADGGDLGYLHQGRLEPQVQQVLAGLAPGEVSQPTRTLEGVALFRPGGVEPARLRLFDEVSERAEELWLRQARLRNWEEFLARLRAGADIYLDRSLDSSDD